MIHLTDEQGEELIRRMRSGEEYLAHLIKLQRVEEYLEAKNDE